MTIRNFHLTNFLKSAFKSVDFPPDIGREVAFIGRSNAGKSSALNALTGQRQLARVSKIPGRTQCINFFVVDEQHRLVDLPGYGYAAVPEAMKEQWHQLINDYLQTRKSLKGLILLIDIRRELDDFELELLGWASDRQLPVHILLTKADKFNRNPQLMALKKMEQNIQNLKHQSPITLSLFSATHRIGLEELERSIQASYGRN